MGNSVLLCGIFYRILFVFLEFFAYLCNSKTIRDMEKNYTIRYGYYNGNIYHLCVRITCKESEVEGIARAIAKGNDTMYCYAEGENGYRLVVCDCM